MESSPCSWCTRSAAAGHRLHAPVTAPVRVTWPAYWRCTYEQHPFFFFFHPERMPVSVVEVVIPCLVESVCFCMCRGVLLCACLYMREIVVVKRVSAWCEPGGSLYITLFLTFHPYWRRLGRGFALSYGVDISVLRNTLAYTIYIMYSAPLVM